MSYNVSPFLSQHPCFTRGELAAFLRKSTQTSQTSAPVESVLKRLHKPGGGCCHDAPVQGRSSIYVTAVACDCPTATKWLPYLLVMKAGQTTVISHQAALRLHLAAQEGSFQVGRGAPSVIRYYDQEANGTRPWHWKEHTFEAAVSNHQPGAKSHGGIPAWCLIPITLRGCTVEIRVTSLEQTLVDIMGSRARRRQGAETAANRGARTTPPPPDGPIELEPDFLECWRELRTSSLQFDFRALKAYLQAVDSRSTTSKVAYYLSGDPERHGVRASHLWALSPRLKYPRAWREGVVGELIFPWLLRVPSDLKHPPVQREDVSEAPRLVEGQTLEKLNLLASLRKPYPDQRTKAKFRAGQDTLILEILKGRDAMGVMPTGAGKSLCYQLPAKLLNGMTLVISPLLALINDQVEKANGLGIPAMAYGRTSDATREQVLLAIQERTLKLLFVSPESLATLIKALEDLKISVLQLVVDEAHTILTWGQDFRFSLKGLHRLRGIWPKAPILALTATANRSERRQLMAELGFHADTKPYVGSTYRPGLYLHVKKVANGFDTKLQALVEFIKAQEKLRSLKLCGIVYCPSKAETERVAEALAGIFGEPVDTLEEQEGLEGAFLAKQEKVGRASKRGSEDETFCLPFRSRVQCYHAGLSQFGKDQAEFVFRKGKDRIMVATVAFGMGVDKSDVRFVVHFGPPTNIGSYVQEVGRAGRDGQEAECLLLHSNQDWEVWKYRFESERAHTSKKTMSLGDQGNTKRERLQRHLDQLKEIEDLLLHSTCLHQAIAKHYDEAIDTCKRHCGKCQLPEPHREAWWRDRQPKWIAPTTNTPVTLEVDWNPVPAFESLGEMELNSTPEVDPSEFEPLWPNMETMEDPDNNWLPQGSIEADEIA